MSMLSDENSNISKIARMETTPLSDKTEMGIPAVSSPASPQTSLPGKTSTTRVPQSSRQISRRQFSMHGVFSAIPVH